MTDRLIETGNCYGMKTNLEEITIMRISWEPSPVQIMRDKKNNWRMWNISTIWAA
jgi:hypothetical protein